MCFSESLSNVIGHNLDFSLRNSGSKQSSSELANDRQNAAVDQHSTSMPFEADWLVNWMMTQLAKE